MAKPWRSELLDTHLQTPAGGEVPSLSVWPRPEASRASAADRVVDPTLDSLWVVSFPGLSGYRPLWDLQKHLARLRGEARIPDTLLLLEHAGVVTLGKNAHREHLLLSEERYRAREIEVVAVDRGGDVTYHGPGQLVGYWIFDLHGLYLDVHRYLRAIEEVLIRTLGRFGICADRSPGATGAWVGNEKIAAIGLHLNRWVSTHGFALNVTTDLEPFSWIVPCGLAGRGVTSMERILGRSPQRSEVEASLIEEAAAVFQRDPVILEPDVLGRKTETSVQPETDHSRSLECPK